MAVPSGDIMDIQPLHEPHPVDGILEQFINGVANMNMAVGIGWAIVEKKEVCPQTSGPLFFL